MALPLVFAARLITTQISTKALFGAVAKGRRKALKESAKEIQQEAKRIMSRKAQKEAYRKANPVARSKAAGRFESRGGVSFSKSGRSKPGELPRRDTGSYQASIKYKVGKALAFVGPSQPKGAHAGMLKWGTKKMQPRLVPAQEALQRLLPRLKDHYAKLF